VSSKTVQDFFALGVTEIVLQSFERIVHDIVVMYFLRRNIAAEFEPD
jgi:hypothetical protein